MAQVAHQCARLASDVENHSLGQYYLLGALRASLKSGNHEFGIRIVADIVDYLTSAGYAYDAIRILKILESTRIANRFSQSPLAITDLLIGRKASALAALGLHDDFEEIVVERRHDACETSGAAMPSWYCPSLTTCELGHGWLSLRDYSRACSYLHRGLAGLGTSDPLTTFYKLSLAQATLQLGDTDTGIYHLRECLQLPSITSTKRNQKKISEIHKWVVSNRDAMLSRNVPDLDKLILQTA